MLEIIKQRAFEARCAYKKGLITRAEAKTDMKPKKITFAGFIR